MPVAVVPVDQAPEIAQAEAAGGYRRTQAAQRHLAYCGRRTVKGLQLDAPGLHAQGLAALEPEPAEKYRGGEKAEHAHQVGVQLHGAVIGRPQPEQ